jgi:hypothetical protein
MQSKMAALTQGFDLLLESGAEEHNGSFFLKEYLELFHKC